MTIIITIIIPLIITVIIPFTIILFHELEMKFGIVLLMDTLRHIVRRIPGCKTVVGVAQ
jgi:hypothetical protein